jgi:predicted nuclease with RNAse H fold
LAIEIENALEVAIIKVIEVHPKGGLFLWGRE